MVRSRVVLLLLLLVVSGLATCQASWAAAGMQKSSRSWHPAAIALQAEAVADPHAAATATPAGIGEAPVTTVTGADALWHKRDVVLTFVAREESASVSAIHLKVDGGTAIEVPSATYQLTIAAPADHSGDGQHLIEYRAVDADGDLEEWKSVTVRIDTRAPATEVLHGVGVIRTTTAEVGFRVEDKLPNAGVADVTIVISAQGGRDVKRVTLKSQTVGKDLKARFRCDLSAGFYRVRIEARDPAGNVATSVGADSLIVTRWMKMHGFGALMVRPSQLVYVYGTPTPRVDTGPHDSQGVRMFVSGGKLNNYPGGQARYGLSNLNAYRLTGDGFYLRRATAQAQRLLNTHVVFERAWFYPQPYSRYRHSPTNNGELMKNPWYSGMAQGQVLSFMVYMYEATGETRYLRAARSTLYSFLYPGPASRPWTVTFDGQHRLWIQEWPRLPLDYTYNGHMIATFGLYDYYRVTKDSLALLLFRAAASTALDYAPAFRRPGSVSSYCLLHRTPNAKYHGVHITCFKYFFRFTGAVGFRRYADIYQRDYSGVGGSRSAGASAGLESLMSESLE